MNKLVFLITTMVWILQNSTQAQTKQVIASAGGSGAGTETSIDWTLGETAIATLSGSNFNLTQGFHQPTFTIVPVGTTKSLPIAIDIFPNPVDNYLIITLHQPDFKDFLCQLYDINGKLLETKKFENENSILPMDERTEGTYLLKIMKGNQEIRIYKIIKH